MAIDNSISSTVYLSRDQIRTQMIEYLQSFLELENVDLLKSSFLSYVVNVISTLTTNLLFYSTSTYKEFFLTKAQLPASVLNLSAFLGYSGSDAIYSTAQVLMAIPLSFESGTDPIVIELDEGFQFLAGGTVPFKTYYDTKITLTPDSESSSGYLISIIITEGASRYALDYYVEDGVLYFVLALRQLTQQVETFGVNEALRLYQFYTIDVPFSGQIYSMTVKVTPPGSDEGDYWVGTDSLYLLNSDDKGYARRRSDNGVTVYFGNGLIGVQPEPGSTIEVTLNLTQGESGNVIAGSLTKGERIYTTIDGINKIVSYTVTNPNPATGGEDEEDIDEIRRNAIASITSLKRFVSEEDFTHADIIIEGSPIGANSISVLKRSDVRINEVQLYTNLEYNGEIVPTKNLFHTFPVDSTSVIQRNTVLTQGDDRYVTLFDMELETGVNKTAYYSYVVVDIEMEPTLIESGASQLDLICPNFSVDQNNNSATYRLKYNSTDSTASQCSCEMKIVETSQLFTMITDSTTTSFIHTFSDLDEVPEGELRYTFTVRDPSGVLIGTYEVTFTLRKDLRSFMLSNMSVDSSGITVYDIPTLEYSYYQELVSSGNFKNFELYVMQPLLASMVLRNYRMLTEFINLKFTTATGIMDDMLLNETTKTAVLSLSQKEVPAPVYGARYIVNGLEGGAWTGHRNEIAECADSSSAQWAFTEPDLDDIVYVADQDTKFIFSDDAWVWPVYRIPLTVEVEVFKDTSYSGSNLQLSNAIKEALLSAYSTRFGSNITLYRSELVDTVQSVEGVDHCRIIQPQSDMFFTNYENQMTQQELLEYSPQYVYFGEDDIFVKVLQYE